MILIERPQTDPYYNIAAEEFIFKKFSEDILMVWYNEPCIVLGKHQNAFSEIDHQYVQDNNIPVIRRTTGGGTVYHDTGNLNYSLIFNTKSNAQVDYAENTKAAIAALKELGLNAELKDKSNITVDGIKVSGNSEHIFKNKVLHHGTLLFSADLDILEKIKGKKINVYQDKAVRSIRKEVINISELLKEEIGFSGFKQYITSFLYDYYNCKKSIRLEGREQLKVIQLAEKKYLTWEWNYGYSPEFILNKHIQYQNELHPVELKVKSGIIKSIDYAGHDPLMADILRRFHNMPLRKEKLEEKLNNVNFAGQHPESLIKLIIQELF